MNEIDANYERQLQEARQLGMQETMDRLEGNVVDIPVLDWVDNMRTRFPLLNEEDMTRYYDQGVQQARENFAVNRAVQMVNDLPDEPSITQKQLSAVHDEFINSRAITDSPSAWIAAAEVVVDKYSHQKQQQYSFTM
jgi:predicted metal-dependent peptidase